MNIHEARQQVLANTCIPFDHAEAMHQLSLLPHPHTPVQEALMNYHRHVLASLPPDELHEVELVYKAITALLQNYGACAALAISRLSLEIGMMKGG